MNSKRLRIVNGVAVLLCMLCFVTGVLWISRLGIQSDEALFTAGIYPPISPQFLVRLFHHNYPLMVMSYVGTLKSALWAPVFLIWAPSAASIRVPAMLLGALTVWIFYRLLLRALGPRAALVGCALLATDSMFLLTSRWDWGPVVLQHLCLVAAMWLLHRFYLEGCRRWLFLGFVVLGLGLWDKAIFIWALAGLSIAALATFPREVWRHFTVRILGIAAAGFLLGCSPLLVYNLKHQFLTFRSNTTLSTDDFAYKVNLLKGTWRGDSLFGSVMRDEWDGPVLEARTAGERVLLHINELGGRPRQNLLLPLLLLCVGVLPFVWKSTARRAAIFSVSFCLVTFLLMAFTKGAGTGTHHSVLLWPMPHLFIAATLAEASRRVRFGLALLGGLMCVICASNLLLTTTYYANMLRNGGTPAWTDAIETLSAALGRERPTRVCLQDWGFFDNLRALHRGTLTLCVAGSPDSDGGKAYTKAQWDDHGNIFVGHTEPFAIDLDSRKRYLEYLKEAGYRRANLRVFQDSNRRPAVELYSVEKDSSR